MIFQNKRVSRRGFFLQLAGLGGVIATLTRFAWAQSARLEVVKDGTNGVNVLATYSPTNSVWELQHSTPNTTSWSLVSTNSLSKYVVTGPGKAQWNFPSTNHAEFFRLLLVTDATIIVGNTTYQVLATGQSLFTAMTNLASSIPSLTFDSREYPDLGQFIISINGTNQGGGLRWILFKNGVSSTKGSSNLILSPGDIIEWRFI